MPPGGSRTKSGIIMPTPDYGSKGGNYVRDRLVRQFGEASVQRAEVAICIQLMIMAGVIKAGDFVELLERILNKTEDQRRSEAGFSD